MSCGIYSMENAPWCLIRKAERGVLSSLPLAPYPQHWHCPRLSQNLASAELIQR